ncbi:MAG TPA: hypothetical protein VFV94_06115 [Polyangiaceae bacterium]|nr:hypothetical protein [Polyangiaceae bacterium]
MRADWRTVRAFGITLVLALGFVAGLPNRIAKLVAPWPKPLAELALKLPPLQQKILAPFAPVAGLLGIYSQDWPLFAGTGGIRYRVWLEARGRGGGRFTLLYRPHDPEHRYLAGALEYRRLLNIYNPHHSWISEAYPDFASALARRIFRERRRFQEVRVRLEEVEILSGGRGYAPTGRFTYERSVRRAELER